jgi:uncharacterized protein (TIGR02145 family)
MTWNDFEINLTLVCFWLKFELMKGKLTFVFQPSGFFFRTTIGISNRIPDCIFSIPISKFPDMKTWLRFFLLMAFLLVVLTFCEKPEPNPVMVKLNTYVSYKLLTPVPLEGTQVNIDIPDMNTDPPVNHGPASTSGNASAQTDYSDAGLPYGSISYLPDHLNPDLTYGLLTDIDNNIYRTIEIGSQTWMAENLRTTRYNDGSKIPNVTDNSTWITLRDGAYRWYNNDGSTYKNLYGALYNWYTVKTGKLCPAGWHVPSDDEWKQLEMTLGMTKEEAESCGEFPGIDCRGTDQGNQMKATSGWSDWEGIPDKGTNTSGFSALPAGESDWSGWSSGGPLVITGTTFRGAGICTTWWQSTPEGGGRALGSTDFGVVRGVYPGICGVSVRCLKDE